MVGLDLALNFICKKFEFDLYQIEFEILKAVRSSPQTNTRKSTIQRQNIILKRTSHSTYYNVYSASVTRKL